MLTLVGRSFALLWRRWPLYLGCALLATIAQGAIVAALHRPTFGALVAEALILPMLATILYAFVDADMRELEDSNAAIWSRVLERVWAVIVIQLIDLILSLFAVAFAASGGTDAGAQFMGFLVATFLDLVLAALVFADVIATVGDEGNPMWLIQHSIGRSVWNVIHGRGNLVRAIVLVVIGFAIAFATQPLALALAARHLVPNEAWAELPFLSLIQLPLAALTVVFYRACVEASNEASHKD